MIMILKSVEGSDKDICQYFLPELKEEGSQMAEMHSFIKEALFRSNDTINNSKKDHRRDRSIGRSLRFSKKGDKRGLNKLSLLEASHGRDLSRSLKLDRGFTTGGKSPYKTLLGKK